MYDSILVVGTGKTSRANIEALIDDYIYANPQIEIYLYSVNALSEGQIWLKQYLEDKSITHRIEIGALDEGTKPSAMFILWSDDDPESNNLLQISNDLGIPAFDLTNGLHQINDIKPIIERPIPSTPVVVEQESDEFEAAVAIFVKALVKELKKAMDK